MCTVVQDLEVCQGARGEGFAVKELGFFFASGVTSG